jgi:GNAT superfamily N-acetyltransferase
MRRPTIREARADEADTLLRIQRTAAVAAFAHIFPPERYPFPDDAVRDGWRTALDDPEVEVFLAEVDGKEVASVSVGHGYLRTLFVLPTHWCAGVGSALHDHALARLEAMNVVEPKLWTLVDNTVARRFYERRGWSVTGNTRQVPFPPYPLDVEYARRLSRAG